MTSSFGREAKKDVTIMRSGVRDKPRPSADADYGYRRPLPAQLCITIRSAFNWRAEHAIRPAVVLRKVCGGNRSARGANTQQILASVLRTAQQRGLDPTTILTTLLRAPSPVVSAALHAPPQ
jgi:hypothetical protein